MGEPVFKYIHTKAAGCDLLPFISHLKSEEEGVALRILKESRRDILWDGLPHTRGDTIARVEEETGSS